MEGVRRVQISSQLVNAFEGDSEAEQGLQIGRGIAKTVAAVVSFGGNYPYVEPCLKLNLANKPFRIWLAVCNVGAFGVVSTWLMWTIIDTEFDEHGNFNYRECSTVAVVKGSARLVGATILGVASNIPSAELVYIEGGRNPVDPAVALACHSIYSIYTFYQFFGTRLSCSGCPPLSPLERKLEDSREALGQALIDNMYSTLFSSPETRAEYLRTLASLKNLSEESQHTVAQLLQHLVGERALRVPPKAGWGLRTAQACALLLGTTLGVSFAMTQWPLGSSAADEMCDQWISSEFCKSEGWTAASDILATAITTTLSGVIVNGIIKAPFEAVTYARNWWYGTQEPDLPSILYPKSMAAAELTTSTMGCFAWGPMVRAVELFWNGPLQIPLSISVGMAVSCLTVKGSQFVVRYVARKSIDRWGTEDEKSLLEHERYLAGLGQAFKASSHEDIARLLLNLPDEVQQRFLAEIGVSVEDLEIYLDEHAEGQPLIALVNE